MQRFFSINKSISKRIPSFQAFTKHSFSGKFRVERDTFGEINVPADRYWAAQTQRSLQNFAIGTNEDKMPLSVIHAMAIIKKSAAKVNMNFGLGADISNSIINAADEVIAGKLDSHFPLVVFQTGSGTQTNMNCNEVISNRGMEIYGESKKGQTLKIHPNDHVNKSQSSNDTYPTGMHVAAMVDINRYLLPTLTTLEATLGKKVNEFKDIIKIGRTHLQDATPLTLGQEFSGYQTQIKNHIAHVQENLKYLSQLAQGGTAVGTGLNTPVGFDRMIAEQISKETGIKFETNPNKFESLATKDALTHFSGTLNSLATSLYKIAHDIKILSTELLELKVKDVSICEEVLNSCVQVMGNHTCVTASNMHGHFELNVFKPVIITNVLNSIYLISNSAKDFEEKLLRNLEPDTQRINDFMQKSLMLVTALNQHIGYDKAAKIAKHCHKNGLTLKEGAIELGFLTAQQFDEWVVPKKMICPDEV